MKMNILSISGGGVRGIIPLHVLKEIETKYNKPISEIFDYYAGSSIGTIIIAGLLISDDGTNPKYSTVELFGMVEKICRDIFTCGWYHKMITLYGWIGSKYPTDNLEKILDEIFGDRKLNNLLKPVCFPSFDGISQKPIYFTKEHHGDLLLKDILRATTAAPTYFDPKEMDMAGIQFEFGDFIFENKTHILYDSGIVVNNPSLVAELHATHDMKIIDKSNIYILCLGTGISKVPQPTNNGVWGWLNSILGYLFNGFNENEMYLLNLALKKKNILYVNVEIDPEYDQLDCATNDSIEYYICKIKNWLEDNEIKFHTFMNKIIN